MQLSENFTLEELTASTTAKVRKITNKPGEIETNNLKLLCKDILQPVRDKYGKPIRVTSGYRSKALNKAVRGSRKSQHLKGEAADIICVNNRELWTLIRSMILSGEIKVGQLINEKNLSWIHISLPTEKYSNQILQL